MQQRKAPGRRAIQFEGLLYPFQPPVAHRLARIGAVPQVHHAQRGLHMRQQLLAAVGHGGQAQGLVLGHQLRQRALETRQFQAPHQEGAAADVEVGTAGPRQLVAPDLALAQGQG